MVEQPLTEVIYLQYWSQGKVLMNWNSNKENIWLFIGLRQSISSECNVSPKPMWSECRNPRFTACQGDTAAYLTLGIGKASFSTERLSKAESFQCFFIQHKTKLKRYGCDVTRKFQLQFSLAGVIVCRDNRCWIFFYTKLTQSNMI